MLCMSVNTLNRLHSLVDICIGKTLIIHDLLFAALIVLAKLWIMEYALLNCYWLIATPQTITALG